MPQVVPVEALPNQAFSITLEASFYEITIKQIGTGMGVTIVRDNVTILSNTPAVPETALIPYEYLEQGNFVFINEGEDEIFYDQFGVSQFLLYVTAAELAAART